jgi:hypothetical protein
MEKAPRTRTTLRIPRAERGEGALLAGKGAEKESGLFRRGSRTSITMP